MPPFVSPIIFKQSQGSVLLQVLLPLLLGAAALFGSDQTPQTPHEEQQVIVLFFLYVFAHNFVSGALEPL